MKTIKRLILIAILLSLMLITSCSKHEKYYHVEILLPNKVELEVVKNDKLNLIPYYEDEVYTESEENYIYDGTTTINKFINKKITRSVTHYIVEYFYLDGTDTILDDKITIASDMKIVPKLFSYTYDVEINFIYNLDLTFEKVIDDDIIISNDENYIINDVSAIYHTFNGWYNNSNLVSNIDATTSANYTLIASWTQTEEQDALYKSNVCTYYDNAIENLCNADMIFNADEILILSKKINNLDDSIIDLLENKDLLDSSLSIVQSSNIIDLADEIKETVKSYNDIYNRTLHNSILSLYEEYEALESTIQIYFQDAKIFNELCLIKQNLDDIYIKYSYIASKIDDELVKIPSHVSYLTYKEVLNIKDMITDDNIIELCLLKDKYETLVLEATEENNKTIHYNFGSTNYYLSRQDLFTAYFTDFYYFILYQGGEQTLLENKITSLDAFLYLASNENAGGTTTMRGIGNIAGGYYLTKDINGIIENQPTTTYIGFCYQNNIYKDFVTFLYNFFAYWRLDEKYANTSNYGADLFAEAWAPTIDTAKFFYYTKESCYIQTSRMHDCYDATPQVIYNFIDYESAITLRGYRFVKWEKEASDATITYTLILDDDEASQTKDAASKVDIYIYNLTTSKANLNQTTVTYVKNMYDALSEYGKTFVENVDILNELIQKYCEN